MTIAAWLALVVTSAAALRWGLWPRCLRLLRKALERRLGGYRQRVVEPDEELPLRAREPKRVAVVGGGLAGIAAASALADRGLSVTLYEREPELGGKCTGALLDVDGELMEIDHGFHAFFSHYYNLNAFLARTRVTQSLRWIDDYVILEKNGRRWGFRDLEATPGLNLVALSRSGLYRLRDILFTRARDELGQFLEYDSEKTFALLDGTSYAAFAERAELPATLRLVFNTFARAFFADDERLSAGELVKSFHFYYLSHDRGLLYQYLEGSYRRHFVAPLRRHLEAQGVALCLGAPVERLERDGACFAIDGRRFDHLVLATTSRGARALVEASPAIRAAAPRLYRKLSHIGPLQRYAVLRLWLDHRMRDDLPVFVATERHRLLDSVTSLHRIDDALRRWASDQRSVVELHCYSVPEGLSAEVVERGLIEELGRFFPELSGAKVIHRHLQLRDDFTAFHVGMHRDRPETTTELDGLVLAGDWVKLPIPAMLMEAAFSSGLYAANAILAREGLRGHAIDSVPQRGLLAPPVLLQPASSSGPAERRRTTQPGRAGTKTVRPPSLRC